VQVVTVVLAGLIQQMATTLFLVQLPLLLAVRVLVMT
jgi:hypothetical protein